MAEEHHPSTNINTDETAVETKDRGLFDFLGKKEEEKPKDEVIATELEKVHVSEPAEPKVEEQKEEEEKKHSTLLDKLRGSDSGSNSSSSDEEVEEGGEKKKKKKENKKKVEDCKAAVPPEEEKKGFVEKIKQKIPGQTKKTEEVHPPPAKSTPIEAHTPEGEPKEKKGILEKIKEKLPGYHSKPEEEKK